MRRNFLPAVDPATKRFSLKQSPWTDTSGEFARRPKVMGGSEIEKWARLLIDQYGAEAEELAEIGVLEMLALKNGKALVTWALISAAIQEIRSQQPGQL